MPDAATETAAAASEQKPPPAVNPDRVGEELADHAAIWPIFDKLAKEDDERRTKTWDNGLNNLALFAGLFSAVTTAFIIEARQDMEPDYVQMTFLVLNATAFGEKPVNQPFVVPQNTRTVNCLWIASLILSLSAALIAIMGKDWIGMYTARPVCNLRQWAEMRTYRLLCVERWYMSGVIAAAPVLLHVSLLLFGAGLVLFISSDTVTHHLTLGISLAAGVLYLVTTLSAVVFSASPFKSPATQIIRAALSAFHSYVYSIICRKRNPVRTLVCEIHSTVLRHADGTPFLPGGPAEKRPWYTALRPALRSALFTTRRTTVAYMRRIPSWICTVRSNLKCSSVQPRLHSISSSARSLSYDLFLSSMWTDLPTDRRPKLLAEALSWLSSASQAPDVFRAIVFALGDLDVGPQVGKHTSLELRTRLRVEIRRTWQQVDFLTLSRYVLAEGNTLGDPVLGFFQFAGRFDLSKDSALRCEDGIAACIMSSSPIIPGWLVHYFPDQVEQPRMHEFLLPYAQKTQYFHTDVLILLSNRYREHLRMTSSFNLGNLEVHLYKTLGTATREKYATAVSVKYSGIGGAIELLTFLCCNGVIADVTIPAAVELVMELLVPATFPVNVNEHRCLSYLFGTRGLWDAACKDKRWSPWSLYWLSRSLEISCGHPFEPTSVRTLSDDRQFDHALARTAVVILSPQHRAASSAHHTYPSQLIECEGQWIQFLHGYLCQSPSPNITDNYEQPDVIQLILDSAALLRIVGLADDDYRGVAIRHDYRGLVIRRGTAILAAIISHLNRCLGDPATRDDGENLLAALAHTEVKGPDGETRIWDLGEWLRTDAPKILKKSPSCTAAMRDVHNALSAIYPLCEHNPELRAIWDRIGYSGPPEEIIYLLDPYLDLGDFFASAEDTHSPQEV